MSNTKQTTSKKIIKKAAKRSNKSHFKRLLVGYGALVILSACLSIIIANRNHPVNHSDDPFSQTQRAAAGFQLYYPSQLPEGYKIDSASLDSNVQTSIVNFRLFDPIGGSIDVTEQKPPSNFNFITLYNTLNGRSSFKSPFGNVYSGSIDENKTHLTYMVTADPTWILIHGDAELPQKDLKVIFGHLAASK